VNAKTAYVSAHCELKQTYAGAVSPQPPPHGNRWWFWGILSGHPQDLTKVVSCNGRTPPRFNQIITNWQWAVLKRCLPLPVIYYSQLRIFFCKVFRLNIFAALTQTCKLTRLMTFQLSTSHVPPHVHPTFGNRSPPLPQISCSAAMNLNIFYSSADIKLVQIKL